jgi:streptogramin lyase
MTFSRGRAGRVSQVRRGARRRRPGVEGLESRRLLAVSIQEYPIPTVAGDPTAITTGSDGNLWFTEAIGNKIGVMNPTTHATEEFPIPTPYAYPEGITAGSDGNIWFTEGNVNKLARLDPTSHAITEFPMPFNSGIDSITTGPDGNLWLAESTGNRIAELNLVTYAFSEFPSPNSGIISGIARGPDGNIWFTEGRYDQSEIGEVNLTTHAVTVYPTPTLAGLSAITAGPDGNLWYTEVVNAGDGQVAKVGQFNPTTHAFAEFQVTNLSGPVPYQTAGAVPSLTARSAVIVGPSTDVGLPGITAGPDGNVWFTDLTGQVGEINPTTHTITEYYTNVPNSQPTAITVGPDGNIWFTDNLYSLGVVRLATPTTTQLTASADPSAVGSPVTFTATVASTGGTPAGLVTFVIDGRSQPPVTLSVVNGQAEATFTTSTLSPGGHAVVAAYAAQGGFGLSISNWVTQAVLDGPTVVAVQRYGSYLQPTRLVLTFDQPLNPLTAQDPSAYRILNPEGRSIPVVVAAYNPLTRSVTLVPAQRLNLYLPYTLLVSGAGPHAVTSAFGMALDGAKTGRPGSNLATQVTLANWVRP